MNKNKITSILLENGLLKSSEVEYHPLQGGVSSDIFLLKEGDDRYVVKQARRKLQVKDDWYADPSRNRSEQKFIRYISQFLPDAVPQILYHDDKNSFFVMEYLDQTFKNWKEQLLKGTFEVEITKKAAKLLRSIHHFSWGNRKAELLFDTTSNFKSLRIEPYLITTGNRHPALKEYFHTEAKELENRRTTLVHGDFSPKNIMVGPDRIVLLDHEVAWYGDPAFDVAFFLTHLYLKQLYHVRSSGNLSDLVQTAWNTYSEDPGKEKIEKLEPGIARLLLMIMLARIDGKSPVEYLDETQKEVVRSFVYEMLSNNDLGHADIHSNWTLKLNSYA